MAYDKLDLIPDPWRQTGIIAAKIHNAWMKPRTTVEECIPRAKEPRIMSGESGIALFQQIEAMAKAEKVLPSRR